MRPDVITEPIDINAKPIPLTLPNEISENRKRRQYEIQDRMMLATTWNKDDDPTGWYVF